MTLSGYGFSSPPLIVLGAGGHAKVVVALLRALGADVKGVCDPGLVSTSITSWRGLEVLGGDEVLQRLDAGSVALVNGLGQVVGSSRRKDMFLELKARGYQFPSLVHPTAWVDPSVELGEGVQVMAGAVIQPDVTIGEDTIINTGSRIDHDCIIDRHVHVAPGAVLCGAVRVASDVFIGAGSTIIQGLSVGQGAIVGAGVTVIRDLQARRVVVSSPVRIHESKYPIQPKKS
ncbi:MULTISPECIES: acetyltransferase [Pseudomonas]|uniref:Acetyltransferase n=1 Tax=Pseudomonas viciae TaxID=2505979 RepID=A0ABY8PIM6_9PSED|nr:acetyltransferase [Pseudomonas viciae]WGO95073.1 acetyltransferase [Pseudomonas viciae]